MAKRIVTDEAFLTSPRAAAACLAALERLFPLEGFAGIVEPSAGDGAFLDLLPVDRRIGIDIRPVRPDLITHDFLAWSPDAMAGPVLVVGNPPFGQRGALAMRFVAHAATFADVIAFILPRGFMKDSFMNRWPEAFHLVHAMPVDEAFRRGDREHLVRTVFQVWERRATSRPPRVRPQTHAHFTMTHAHLSRTTPEDRLRLRAAHAFTIPQVGTRFVPRDVDDVETGSHWFIRPCAPSVRCVFERLDFAFLAGMSTAHTSLSKADIVQAYEAALTPELRALIDREVAGVGAR